MYYGAQVALNICVQDVQTDYQTNHVRDQMEIEVPLRGSRRQITYIVLNTFFFNGVP